MSLQVWLPLNGDLHNQGLSGELSITNNGATVANEGKISGSCYYFNSKTLVLPSYSTTRSICFWVKAAKTNSTIAFVDYQSKLGFGFNSSGYIIPNSGSGSTIKMYSSDNFKSNEWNHVALIRDDDFTDVLLYLNGVLQTTRSSTNAWGNTVDGCYFGGRSTGTYMTCYINDIRIYDHALSAKEVEELAKGLVLHYPLNDGANNISWLLPNSETTITRASGNTFVDYNYYSDLITNSETSYIVDFYAKGSVDAMKMDVYFRNSSGSAYALTSSQTLTTTWKHYSLSLSGSPSSLQLFRARCYGGTAGDIISIRNMRLLSNNMPIRTSIIYDCSGYANNGTIIGEISAAAGSPRYDVYTNLTTTASHIYIPNLNVSGFPDSYSISWWGNVSSYSGKMMWGFTDGCRLNGIYNGTLWNTGDGSNNPLYKPGTTTQVSAPTVNEWHHFVMTGNGSTCKVYKDGELWGQAKTYKSLSGTAIYMNGWADSTNYSLANTKLSDFRIYSTELSAAAIKELYNTSMSIDSNGNVYARELVS